MKQFNGLPADDSARYNGDSSGAERGASGRNGHHPGVPLHGKVALIISGVKGTEQSLAVDFAERGMDVALIYFGDRYEQARSLKREVEKRNRRCLLIDGDRAKKWEREAFGRHVVARILDALGRLDIFISLRTGPFDETPPSGQETGGEDALRKHLFPDIAVMKAALEHIVN